MVEVRDRQTLNSRNDWLEQKTRSNNQVGRRKAMSERRDIPSDKLETPSPYDRGDIHERQRPYDPEKEDIYQQEIEQTEDAKDE
jgi:hypothetical protein